jgi:hypothetical protein
VKGGRLVLTDVEGEVGSSSSILVRLPDSTRIDSLSVNGTAVAFHQSGSFLSAQLRFAGDFFTSSQSLWSYDPAFAGGTIRATFKIPPRIFAQLQRRHKEWPVPYTEDDLIATWLGSYRLLLYAHIAEPDDTKEITLTIDGKTVPVLRAYNNIYGGNKRNYLGNYADVSFLEPSIEHHAEVTVPASPPGRFQGLFFENIQPEFTRIIVK